MGPDAWESAIWKNVLKREVDIKWQSQWLPTRRRKDSNAGVLDNLGYHHDDAMDTWKAKNELAGRPPFVHDAAPFARPFTADSNFARHRHKNKHNEIGMLTDWGPGKPFENRNPVNPRPVALDYGLSKSFRNRNLEAQLCNLHEEDLSEVLEAVRRRLEVPALLRPQSAPTTKQDQSHRLNRHDEDQGVDQRPRGLWLARPQSAVGFSSAKRSCGNTSLPKDSLCIRRPGTPAIELRKIPPLAIPTDKPAKPEPCQCLTPRAAARAKRQAPRKHWAPPTRNISQPWPHPMPWQTRRVDSGAEVPYKPAYQMLRSKLEDLLSGLPKSGSPTRTGNGKTQSALRSKKQ